MRFNKIARTMTLGLAMGIGATPALANSSLPHSLLQAVAQQHPSSQAPVAEIETPYFLLDVADNGTSNMIGLDLKIQGIRATHYLYKFGPEASTECADDAGYSAPRADSQRLKLDISGAPDGDVVLCLVGLQIKNGVIKASQPFSDATEYAWQKDTTNREWRDPVAVIAERKFLRDIADGVSDRKSIDSRVRVRPIGTHYRYKFGPAASTNCAATGGYGAYVSKWKRLSFNFASTPDGNVRLCLQGARYKKTTLTYQQINPTAYNWKKSTGAPDTTPPGVFSIVSPSGAYDTQTPMVVWGAAADAAAYDVKVASNASCSVVVQQVLGVTGTSTSLPAPLADGGYFTCVTARDTAGNVRAASNNGLAFSVDATPPAPFAILAPSGLGSDSTLTATWEISTGASSYDVIVAANVTCTAVVQQVLGVTATSVALAALGDGSYFLCVSAEDAVGNVAAASNNGASFAVDTTAPGAFSIAGPSGLIATAAPEASWSAAAGATHYDVTVSGAADCSAAVYQNQNVSGTSLQLPNLANGSYYLCVVAVDGAGNATDAANDGVGFTVDATPPGAFSILVPVGSVFVSAPVATWEVSDGAVAYDFVVASDSQCTEVIQQAQNLTGNSLPLQPLADGTYFVCMVARDAAQNAMLATNNGASFSVNTAPTSSHLIFTTSSLHGVAATPSVPPEYPNFGSLEGADWICTLAAYNSGLIFDWNGVDGLYKAVLSTDTVSARNRIVIGGPVYNRLGELVAADHADLFDGGINALASYDEFGNDIGTDVVWTGSTATGMASGQNCGNWGNPGASGATSGTSTEFDSDWLTGGTQSCANVARLYCVSPAM